MEALTLFLWGENLELLGFLVVAGGYLKKYLGVLSLLSYRFSNGLIQTGFEHERLKG
ncbi:hypothetical protein JT240_01230 [Helicobacter pylori]|nr:hypothetical protein [Helicobacter pylori]